MLTDKDLEELRQERRADYLAEAARQASAQAVSARERALIAALQAIVRETMDYPPVRPYSGASYLPCEYVEAAQKALAAYGEAVQPQIPEAA